MTDDKLISNISYTNKDFNQIYPELLDLVKKLTNKWDPSLSNESDPGVILIKELAIMGDKLNYNIDKNVLECFPLSVTQEGNARQLYDSLGYRMHWYESAEGNVIIQPKKSLLDIAKEKDSSITNVNPIRLPQFTTLTDSSGEVIYSTLVSRTIPSTSTDQITIPCIQGTPKDYKIDGSSNITLNNLDNDLRLYFSEYSIAENGIFIKDKSDTDYNLTPEKTWTAVNNIESYPSGSKVFEFGVLPNSNTCYIQFPQDISTQIGDGINIKYIVSDGEDGNIKANTIQAFINDITFQPTTQSETITINDYIRVYQTEPITNGVNPETIDQAYTNYKKTIGVFNTLVTKRDYQDYIYEYGSDECSNIIIADRTNDINTSVHLQNWSLSGDERQLLISDKSLTPYEIKFYMTEPVTSIYNDTTYNNTYKPLYSENIGRTLDNLVNDEYGLLANIKSIQHNFQVPQVSDLFNIRNNYIIKGILFTSNKVTKEEAKEIQDNVRQTLYKYCNGREMQYGEQLAYDTLVQLIQNADTRIKLFSLNSLNYRVDPIRLVSGSDGISVDNSVTYINEMLAKMILSGNVQLFTFDDEFVREFGQINEQESSNVIKTITSWFQYTVPTSEPNEGLPNNSTIQMFAQNLIKTQSYGVGVKVKTNGPDIPANTYYKLTGNETITLSNLSNIPQSVQLTAGTIINSSIDIRTTDRTLSSSQELSVYSLNQYTLKPGTPYYIILNNEDNKLELNKDNPYYILQENEYFIYTNTRKTDALIILGSGTKLSCDSEDGSITFNRPKLGTNVLTKLSTTNFTDIDWAYINDNINTITTTEMQIVMLQSGDKIWYTGDKILELSKDEPRNKAIDIPDPSKINYQKAGEANSTSLPFIKTKDGFDTDILKWSIESRLQINASNLLEQQLTQDQYIQLDNNTPITVVNNTPTFIVFNYPVILAGGNKLNASVLLENGKSDYLLKAMWYNKKSDIDISRSVNNFYKITDLSKSLPYTFRPLTEEDNYWILPIYVNINSGSKIQVEYNDVALTTFTKYLSDKTEPKQTVILEGTNSYILYIPGSELNQDNKITFSINSGTWDSTKDSIYVGMITKINGINSDEIDSERYSIENNKDSVIKDMISYIGTKDSFDWTYKPTSDNKVLNPTDPISYWDKNHIYNEYTIAKIDFDNYDVSVNPANIS